MNKLRAKINGQGGWLMYGVVAPLMVAWVTGMSIGMVKILADMSWMKRAIETLLKLQEVLK